MAIEFACPACGRALRAEEQYQGRQTRCPACGALASIPAVAIPDLETALQPAATMLPGREPRIAREPSANSCPECHKPMDPRAVVCIECGFDRRRGRQLTTKVRRFEHSWNTGISLPGRIFAVVLTDITIAILLVGVVVYFDLHPALLLAGFGAVALVSVANLGTFNLLYLDRTKRGRLDLTRRAFFAFIPYQTKVVDLRTCVELRLDAGEGPDALPGFTGLSALMMGACTCWLIGAAWYIYQSSQVRVTLRLVARRDRDSMTLYSGTDEELMRDIVNTIQGVTNLPLRR